MKKLILTFILLLSSLILIYLNGIANINGQSIQENLELRNNKFKNIQAEEWLSIEDEYFIINYKNGKIYDAELILTYCQFGYNVTKKLYPHELDVKVTVYLYDINSWTLSPYSSWAEPNKAEMYFLTPSDVPEYAR